MKAMHAVIPNYGVVIIILVFLMRLVMHPITKKSQVSMSKMSKLAPRAEEIKKKYANNKAGAEQEAHGTVSRAGGFADHRDAADVHPDARLDGTLERRLHEHRPSRGAAFLPFWITDLSLPDALIRVLHDHDSRC